MSVDENPYCDVPRLWLRFCEWESSIKVLNLVAWDFAWCLLPEDDWRGMADDHPEKWGRITEEEEEE